MDKAKVFVYFLTFLLAFAVTYLIVVARFSIQTFGLLLFFLVFIPTLINLNIGFVIIIVAMLFSPESIMGYAGYRQLAIRVEDVLLAMVVLAWFIKTAVTKNIADTFKTTLTKPFFLYLSVCILSTVISVNFGVPGAISPRQASFHLLKYLEYFILFLMVKDHLSSLKQAKLFIIAFFIVALLVSIHGHIHIAQQQEIGAEFFRVGPPAGTRGGAETATMGGYLLFMMAMAGGVLLYTRSMPQRAFLICLTALMFRAFLYTLSRGSYLGFIAVVFGFLFFIKNPTIKIRLISVLLAFFIFLAIFMPQMIRKRIVTTLEVKHAETGIYIEWEDSPQARIDSWKKALFQRFPRSPFLGHGVTKYFVDSQLFSILLETGLLGLILFTWLLVRLFRAVQGVLNEDLIKGDSLATGLCVGFLAGLMGLLVASSGANIFIIIKIMEPFWFMAAIVLSMPRLLKLEKEKIAGITGDETRA